jgi:MFS transporter, AAHS family, 4-hydroxybenzoate transporter
MQKKNVDVTQIIESARFIGLPLLVALMAICIMLSDGFDLFTMGYVGPHMLKDWGITRPQLGPVNSAGLIGMAIGSVALGWLGDRIGRKRAYVTCLAFLFVGSILCYYAKGVWDLAAWRLVTGLGLGGVTPLATTLVSEWTSSKVRSVAVACVIVAVPLGGTLAGIVERMIIPEYGWRSMFLVGALVPLALFAIFSFLLPESPKYLAQHPSEHPRLAKALNRLVGEQRFDGTENFVVHEQSKLSSHWLATIWNSNYWRATAFIWVAFAINSFVLYLYTNYLPTLLDYAEQSAEVASKGLSRFSGGAALGSIGGAILIGLFGSRWVGTGLAFVGAVASAIIGMTLIGQSTNQMQLLILCLIAGASINGMQAFMYTVAAHSYPTSIRGSAVGMAQTFSRLGAVASPSVASYYFAMEPPAPVSTFFWFIAICALVTTTSFFLIPSHVPANK